MSRIFQIKLDRNSSIREEVEHRKSSRYNKLTDGRSDKLIDGKSLITDFVGATGKIVTIFTLLLSAGCMIAMLLVGHFFVYYVVVCIYEIIIICHYGYPLIKFLVLIHFGDKNDVEAVDADSCWSILYKYWLEWQIGFCFSFSLITSILLFTYLGQTTPTEQTTKYAVEGLSYLFGAFSIPLPLICLRMYPNEKRQPNNTKHVAKRWSI
eukprot:UN05305